MSYDILTALAGFAFVTSITPGPNNLMLMASGANYGFRRSIPHMLGIGIGFTVMVIVVGLGLMQVFDALPLSYVILKYAGMAYLLWLAWQAWTAKAQPGMGRGAPSVAQAIRRGFLTNVLNPKTALFIFAFIPQFTRAENGPVWAQILILGAIFLINGFVFSLTLGALAGLLADRLRARVRVMNKISAILFGGLAARLILD